ncbi:FtsX-like permease family protein [Pseudonocardiaceae bacterium YIM PH 21723]|nr:FtsX-like permease family protein [Pseudonocardiaceae bacterium YIM PH 21723]
MWRVAMRGLLRRKLRLALSGISVLLGVMAVSGSMIAAATLGEGFTRTFGAAFAGVDVMVTGKPAPGQQAGPRDPLPPVTQSTVDKVSAVDGVDRAFGVVTVDGARPVGKDGKVIVLQGPPRYGVDWRGESDQIQLRTGRGPSQEDEVAINAGLAEIGGFAVGDPIDVITSQPRRTFRISGIYGYRDGRASLGGETQVAFTPPVAQQLMLGGTGRYSSITVKSTVDPAVLKDRVAGALGNGFLVRTGKEASAAATAALTEIIDLVGTILLGFSALALLVGVFLVVNTFTMLLAQRTGELALLRAIGASRSQLIGMVQLEAAVVGLAASVVGFGLGIGVAALLKAVMQSRSGSQLPVGILIPEYALPAALVVGVLVTCAAALWPALRAAAVPPVAAMRASAVEAKGIGVLTAVGAVLSVAAVASLSAGLGYPGLLAGIVLLLLGVGLLTPLLSRWAVRAISWPVRRLVGAPGLLGERNAVRNPRRTAATVAMLMIGVALVSGVSVVTASLQASATASLTTNLGSDLVITGDSAGPPRGAGRGEGGPPKNGTPSFDESVIARTRALPGVAGAAAVRTDQGVLADTRQLLFAADVPVLLSTLGIHSDVSTVDKDAVLLDDESLRERGLRAGDTVTVTTSTGVARQLRVAGTYAASYLLRGPLLSTADGFAVDRPSSGYIDLVPGADAGRVKAEVSAMLRDNPEITVADSAQLVAASDNQIASLQTVLYVLLGLAVLIGVLGVANTMALSIVERTRELGLLRAIGLHRGEVLGMVSFESVLLALFGAALGVGVGVAAGVATVHAAAGDGLGTLALPWGTLAAFLALAVLSGVVAAALPARRAARTRVLSAVAYG